MSTFKKSNIDLKFNYAGFWLRFHAALIDLFILGTSWIGFGSVFHLYITYFFEINSNKSVDNQITEYAEFFLVLLRGISLYMFFAIFESSKYQASPGKKVLGLRVTDESGERISFNRAAIRQLSKFYSFSFLFIGFLMSAWTKKKQTLHDKLTNTLVLKHSSEVKSTLDTQEKVLDNHTFSVL